MARRSGKACCAHSARTSTNERSTASCHGTSYAHEPRAPHAHMFPPLSAAQKSGPVLPHRGAEGSRRAAHARERVRLREADE
eukprot:422514-Pyramimonas_sp.AAC.1